MAAPKKQEAGALDAVLRETEERYRLAARATRDVVWDWNFVGGSIDWSDAMASRFGYGVDRTSPDWWKSRIHPDDRAAAVGGIEAAISRGDEQRWAAEYRFRRADGGYADVSDCGYIIKDAAGRPVRMVGVMHDLSARKAAERALAEQGELYRYTIELSSLIPWTADADGRVLELPPRWLAITGLPGDLGAALVQLLHPDDRKRALRQWRDAVRRAERFDGEFRIKVGERYLWHRARAAPRRDEVGRVLRWYGTVEDVHERKTVEEALLWSATHDSLTGLPNRAAFNDALNGALSEAAVRNEKVGVALVDIDEFKQLNDAYGHDVGDAVLRALGGRLFAAVRENDLPARLGGDEFAVLLPDVRDAEEAAAVARAVQASLAMPELYLDHAIDCRGSIGIALFPEHGGDATTLLKSADIALYEAKATDHSTIRLFEPQMRVKLQRRSSMVEMARRALRAGRVLPFYQPKVDLTTGAVAGFEALLRWHDTHEGVHAPASIADAFADNELARELGDTMVDQVLADVRGWLAAGVPFGRVAINAAAAEFQRDGFAERLLLALHRAEVPTCFVEVEVTETVFIGERAGVVERALRTLSGEGVVIALDDFGTGFASLSHLKQFPVDALKIDKSFVDNLTRDPRDAAIVRAVIGLGASLSMNVVAEGVETAEQLAFLKSAHCAQGQGHLFGEALPAASVPGLVAGPAIPGRAAGL